MHQLKKLLFDEDFSDVEGYIWRFNFYKAIAWCVFLLVISIIVYGEWIAENSHEFFGNVLFYFFVIVASIAVILFTVGTIKKAKKVIGKFLLILICIVFAYGIIGSIFQNYWFGFHMGYSTWIVLTTLAGFGATREYIFNGHLDRHDAFYCCLIFIVFVGANWRLNQNGGFLENLDILINKIMNNIGILSNFFQ